MTKISNPKPTSNVLDIDNWNLEFICYLNIVIWCFLTSTLVRWIFMNFAFLAPKYKTFIKKPRKLAWPKYSQSRNEQR